MSENGPANVYAHAQQTVDDQRERINRIGDDYRDYLTGALDELKSIRLPEVAQAPAIAMPDAPELTLQLDPIPSTSLEIGALLDVPAFAGVDDLLQHIRDLDLSLGDLPSAPQAPLLHIPEAPAEDAVVAPPRPAIDTTVDLPAPPSTALPEMEALLAINVPAFEFPDLPTFNGTSPAVDFSVPDSVLVNWTEPTYRSQVLDELLAEVRRMMAGGTGLPPAVEQALFARARERASADVERAVQDAFADWAARGFDMPPGMLAKQVSVAREQGQLRAAELNREILIEATKWEIDNLRFAVQQGLALEGLTTNLFENSVKRLYEAARFHAESQISLLNARVAVFNARNEAFRSTAEVYRTQLEGVQARLQAYRTAVDAQAVVGQINAQKVEVFKARLQAVQADVAVFQAMMDGAKLKSEAARVQLEAYRTDVQAYAERLQAQKARFDAYESRLRGESAKADVFEAQTRAYAETVRAITAKTDAQRATAQIATEAARVQLSAYEAQLRGVDQRNQVTFRRLETDADVFRARLSAWDSKARAQQSESELRARHVEATLRTNLAYAETKLKEYQVKLERSMQETQIALESAKAMGQYGAQMAAGALSAVNIGASVSASGGVNESYGRSTTTNYSYRYGDGD